MISMPQNICICADCMQKTFDTMNNGGYDDIMKFSGMPGIHFMNMSDMGEIPQKQKIKKKKKENKIDAEKLIKELKEEINYEYLCIYSLVFVE